MSWAWDFGDGSTSTEQNPTRLFAGPGSYQVTLTVTNEFTSSEPAVEIVEVAEPAQPVASFDWTDLGNGNEVAFVDTSDSGDGATITAWSWDFDNGAGSSTVQNPVYSFGGPGAYPVRLTVTNSFMETDQVLDIVNVDPAPVPTADFTFQSVGVNEVSFTDTSTTPVGTTIDSWDWDFGDGGTSAAQNPTYTFGDAGPHAVELTVTNSATGTDTSVQLVPAP
jgi:PKD repeat protein